LSPRSVPFLNVERVGIPLVPVAINNTKCVALVDSGSVLNIVNASLLNKLPQVQAEVSPIPIKTVDSVITLNRKIDLTLQLGGHDFKITCYISPTNISNSFDVLLGSSFLAENLFTLNFTSNKLDFPDFLNFQDNTSNRDTALSAEHSTIDNSLEPTMLSTSCELDVNNAPNLNTNSTGIPNSGPFDSDNDQSRIDLNFNSNMTSQTKFNNCLYVNRKVTIPPLTEQIVFTNTKDKRLLCDQLFFVNPLTNVLDNSILVAKSIASNTSNVNIPVLVLNHTSSPITLNKHKYIAMLEPLHDATETYASVYSNQIGECHEVDLNWSDQFDVSHLDDVTKLKLSSLLEKNKTVFAKSVLDLEGCDTVLHRVQLTDNIPVKRKPYRPPFYLKDELNRQVNLLLEAGILTPSTSAYSSPVCLVKKSNGEMRMVADFRHLNLKVVKDSYPLPLIQENIDSLANAKFFSTLDLTSGFFQQVVHPEDRHKLAISTPQGLFQFSRSPFGLATSPPAFQRLMHVVLNGLSPLNISCYLDDIVVASDTIDSHLDKLQLVFDRLKLHRLKLKPSKCIFIKQEIEFLGYVVSGSSLKPKSKNLETIKNFKIPSSKRDVRSFLGAVNYYRRLIPDLSKRSVNLTNLTKDDSKFEWTDETQSEFDDLRFALSKAPCLTLPDMSKEFVLFTDASKYALGCVIAQLNDEGFPQPVAFASKKLSPAETRFSTTEREIFAIVWGVNYFKYFLQGRHFKVFSDHKSLTGMLKLRDPTNRIARWAVSLGNFDFQTVYIKGKSNSIADFLSRSVETSAESETPSPVFTLEPSQVSTVTFTMQGDLYDKIKAGQVNDEKCKIIINRLEKNLVVRPIGFQFFVEDGVLKCLKKQQLHNRDFQSKLFVPKDLVDEVLESCHDSVTSCHPGFLKTLLKVKHHFYFPSMNRLVKDYIKSCILCNRRRAHKPHFLAPLQRKPISEGPGLDLSADFVGPLPITEKGNRYVLFFTDFFTRYTAAYPTPDMTSHTVALCLLNYISKFGCPVRITTDKGSSLISEAIKYVYNALGISQITTSSFHSAGNGMQERVHFTLEDNLAFLVDEKATDWDVKLDFALMAYNASQHMSTGFSPSYLMFGREITPPDLLKVGEVRSYSEADGFARELVNGLHSAYVSVKRNLEKAAEDMEKRVLGKSRSKNISVGDLVFLFYPSLGNSSTRKFSLPNRGPYKVVQKLSEVNFRIQSLSKPTDIQVVHVNRLSKFTPRVPINVDPTETDSSSQGVGNTVPKHLDLGGANGAVRPTHGYNLRNRVGGFVVPP